MCRLSGSLGTISGGRGRVHRAAAAGSRQQTRQRHRREGQRAHCRLRPRAICGAGFGCFFYSLTRVRRLRGSTHTWAIPPTQSACSQGGHYGLDGGAAASASGGCGDSGNKGTGMREGGRRRAQHAPTWARRGGTAERPSRRVRVPSPASQTHRAACAHNHGVAQAVTCIYAYT